MDKATCRTCKETYPLIEEFWHRNSNNESGFAIHCKTCARAYNHERYLKGVESLDASEIETFGGFEAESLAQRWKRMNEPVISIYKEI